MTLEKLKTKWKDEISNWTAKNLMADDEFIADSMNYPELREYVSSVRAEMKPKNHHTIKFKGLGHVTVTNKP